MGFSYTGFPLRSPRKITRSSFRPTPVERNAHEANILKAGYGLEMTRIHDKEYQSDVQNIYAEILNRADKTYLEMHGHDIDRVIRDTLFELLNLGRISVEKLTIDEAYRSMYYFLEDYYRMTKSDDIGGMLGSLAILEDGYTADEAAWHD